MLHRSNAEDAVMKQGFRKAWHNLSMPRKHVQELGPERLTCPGFPGRVGGRFPPGHPLNAHSPEQDSLGPLGYRG